MTRRRALIFGAGGFAREVAEMLTALGDVEVVGFVEPDDPQRAEILNGVLARATL